MEQSRIMKELITNPSKYNLTKPPDGISVSVIDEKIIEEAIDFIDKSSSSGIPIITFDSDAPNSKRLAYVGTDNFQFGNDLGKMLDKINPNGTKYGIITDMSGGPNLQLRVDGVRYRLEDDNLHPTNWKEVDYSPMS